MFTHFDTFHYIAKIIFVVFATYYVVSARILVSLVRICFVVRARVLSCTNKLNVKPTQITATESCLVNLWILVVACPNPAGAFINLRQVFVNI
jgi:hypothetical protein